MRHFSAIIKGSNCVGRATKRANLSYQNGMNSILNNYSGKLVMKHSSEIEIKYEKVYLTKVQEHENKITISKIMSTNCATLLLNEGIPRALKGKKLRLKNPLLFPSN